MTNNTDNGGAVGKNTFTLYILWIALMVSVLLYGVMLVIMNKAGNYDQVQVPAKDTLLVIIGCIVAVTTLLSFKKEAFIKKNNIENAPYAKAYSDDEKRVLAYYSRYLVFHILLWCLNDAAAIIGFILSLLTGNITYYAGAAAVSLSINFFLLKPTYLQFVKGKLVG